MSLTRDLTTLEYVVLGFIDLEPQSGYSLLSELEARSHRWSASPGAVYPILKRLEQAELLQSELETPHETRPRKMYILSPFGEQALDQWLRQPLSEAELLEERDITLLKFLFMEKRLAPAEVLDWLKRYELGTIAYQVRWQHQNTPDDRSIHKPLILRATQMEIEMQLTWIRLATSELKAQM